jgi:hypothetical protein
MNDNDNDNDVDGDDDDVTGTVHVVETAFKQK